MSSNKNAILLMTITTITFATTFTMFVENGAHVTERVVWEIVFVCASQAPGSTIVTSTKKPWWI